MKTEINQLMHQDAILPRLDSDNSSVLIEETQNQDDYLLKELIITNLKADSVELKLDQRPSDQAKEEFGQRGHSRLSRFVDDEKNKADRRCDIIIIEPKNSKDEYRIVFAEMKTTIKKVGDFKVQLLNSRVYVDYILELIRVHYDKEVYSRYEYVVFYKNISEEMLQKFNQSKGCSNQKNSKGNLRLIPTHKMKQNYNVIWEKNGVPAGIILFDDIVSSARINCECNQ